nr:hypothetical protein GCM10020241_30270 [Streptoalloteichus tenebrarius]
MALRFFGVATFGAPLSIAAVLVAALLWLPLDVEARPGVVLVQAASPSPATATGIIAVRRIGDLVLSACRWQVGQDHAGDLLDEGAVVTIFGFHVPEDCHIHKE